MGGARRSVGLGELPPTPRGADPWALFLDGAVAFRLRRPVRGDLRQTRRAAPRRAAGGADRHQRRRRRRRSARASTRRRGRHRRRLGARHGEASRRRLHRSRWREPLPARRAIALAGRRPIVAIPTTSGTGAEVTRTCILSDAEGQDVDLGRRDAPRRCHPRPDGNGVDAAARHHLHGPRRAGPRDRGVHRATTCRPLHSGGAACDDARARAPPRSRRGCRGPRRPGQAMQEAALLAGVAIDNCGTGIAHAIGHALGTLHHVPHGQRSPSGSTPLWRGT